MAVSRRPVAWAGAAQRGDGASVLSLRCVEAAVGKSAGHLCRIICPPARDRPESGGCPRRRAQRRRGPSEALGSTQLPLRPPGRTADTAGKGDPCRLAATPSGASRGGTGGAAPSGAAGAAPSHDPARSPTVCPWSVRAPQGATTAWCSRRLLAAGPARPQVPLVAARGPAGPVIPRGLAAKPGRLNHIGSLWRSQPGVRTL